MIRRALLSTLLALSLVLTGTAAVVAETRMAAAGGFCGAATPDILLDAAGLPQLDGDGQAVAGFDCPICTLSAALDGSASAAPTAPHRLVFNAPAGPLPTLSALETRIDRSARAPPARMRA